MTRIELRQLEEGKTELLVMEVKHINGVYRLTVNRKTISTRNGFICEEWIPFQDGNFNFTVTTGRKSQKKLDTLKKIINKNYLIYGETASTTNSVKQYYSKHRI